MVTDEEFDPQSLHVFCRNIECGAEKFRTFGGLPLRERTHRPLEYSGSVSVGWSDMFFGKLFRNYHFPEMGAYHFYACPVCGEETVFLEKWGVLKRVYCAQIDPSD
jgi:hypothetical protein